MSTDIAFCQIINHSTYSMIAKGPKYYKLMKGGTETC